MFQEKPFLRTQSDTLQSNDEAKFIVCIFLPHICISAIAFTAPSEFYLLPEIQSLARWMFLNLSQYSGCQTYEKEV